MPSPPAIRRLLRSDVADYRTIRLATLATEPEFFGASYETEASLPLAHFIEALETSVVFGAYDGSEIVGIIRFTRGARPKDAHKGAVHGFFVRPDRRGQGFGSALMTTLIETARELVEHLTLSVVQGNTEAIGLYHRFGFATYGIEPRARRNANGYSDLVLMVLFLSSRSTSAGTR
jgi:ribosomal protein S18 acetylase RimI-like enzyme